VAHILTLETASSLGWAALDGDVRSMRLGPLQSHRFVLMVQELLAEHGVQAAQLSEIRVGTGPGSFTGLRIAAAFAQGLHLANGTPLTTFCSLQAYLPLEEGPFLAAFDARGGGAYVLLGGRTPAAIEWCSEPARSSLEELQINARRAGRIVSPDPTLKERISTKGVHWIDGQPSLEVVKNLKCQKSETCFLQLLYAGQAQFMPPRMSSFEPLD
jgi:tRNA threonylcarbamoyl adenosine modification protein YeaZ